MLGRPASSSFPAFGMAGSAALGAGGGGGGGGVGVGSVRGGGGGGIGGSHTTTALAALRTKQQQASAAALDASSARRILSPFAAGATAVGLAPARYDCMTSRVTRVQLQSIVPTIFITVLLSTPWSFSLSLSRAAWLLTLSLVTCIPLVPISFFKGRVTTVSRRPRSLTATISDFFRADQMLLVASYSFSALATFLVRANLSKSTGAWSSMFLKPQGRYGPTQLNETFVFTFFAAVLLGPLYAIGLHAAERHSLSFPSLQRRWRQRYFSSVSMFISWSFRYALFFAAAYWLCYGVFGGLIFFVVSAGFQPFTGVTLQRLAQFTIFDWRIVSHVFLEALHIVVFWESFSSIFECILTEPAPQNPLDSRVSDAIMGIQAAKQPYAQALAMLDILLIAKKDAQARKEMFNDPSELEMSPWTLAAATCLDHVDKVSERLEFLNGLREKELAKTRSSIPFGAPPLSLRVSPHKVALKEEQIMNPPKKSFMDSIFSVLSEPEVNPDPTAQKLYEKKRPEPKKTIPTLLQRPPAPSSNVFETPSPPASAPTPKVVRSTGEMVQEEAIAAATWTLKTAQWLGSKFLVSVGLKKPRSALDEKAEADDVFNGLQMQIWAIEAVSHLLCEAAREDSYGAVHHDVPTVLNSLLRCLVAVELHASKRPWNVKAVAARGARYSGDVSVVLLREPLALIDVLQTSIYRIVVCYEDYMQRYLPYVNLAVSPKLHRFMELKE